MSATDEQQKQIRKAFGAWLLREIAEHEWDRSAFIERVGYGKGTVSRWINGEALPSPAALVAIARVLQVAPDAILFRAAGREGYAGDDGPPLLSLPPDLSRGESRLVEHLAWAVRHWREEQNAARAQEGVEVA